MALWTDQGGYLASLNLSKELRTALKPGLRFRQFCDIKDPEQQGAMPEVVERIYRALIEAFTDAEHRHWQQR